MRRTYLALTLLVAVTAGLGLLLARCSPSDGNRSPSDIVPEDDATFVNFAPGTGSEELAEAIEEGLLSRGGAARPDSRMAVGIDSVRFVVIRAGERQKGEFHPKGYHVVVGGGVRLKEGALRIRRHWGTSGVVDGNNEQPEVLGIAVVVEPGAQRPYGPAIVSAVTSFVTALAARTTLHPDLVLAMEEIPYTRAHEADLDERALASSARQNLPPPPAPGRLTIVTEKDPILVAYEHRNTTPGIRVGMMLRRQFDGENRGMLFEYDHPDYRWFWMWNCRISIDVAYIREGRIEQIREMEPQPGPRNQEWRRYSSNAAVKYALEMPSGWFRRNGVRVGDRVELE